MYPAKWLVRTEEKFLEEFVNPCSLLIPSKCNQVVGMLKKAHIVIVERIIMSNGVLNIFAIVQRGGIEVVRPFSSPEDLIYEQSILVNPATETI